VLGTSSAYPDIILAVTRTMFVENGKAPHSWQLAAIATALVLLAPACRYAGRESFVSVSAPVVAITHVRVIDGTGTRGRDLTARQCMVVLTRSVFRRPASHEPA